MKAKTTINKHRLNIDLFLNHYLLYYDVLQPSEGIAEVDEFLGHWFIRKVMWASSASIKSNAVSLKKFYAFMVEKGLNIQAELDNLTTPIKEELP